MITKPLSGHESAETSFVAENYPYGGLRTQMRFWVETKKTFGQRLVTQSLNPKTGSWNKPHNGQYAEITVLFLDENGHCHQDGLGGIWHTKERIDSFEKQFGTVLTEWQKNKIKNLRIVNRVESPQHYFGLSDDQIKQIRAKIQELKNNQPKDDAGRMIFASQEEKETFRQKIVQIYADMGITYA